jgi:hypothetical protein
MHFVSSTYRRVLKMSCFGCQILGKHFLTTTQVASVADPKQKFRIQFRIRIRTGVSFGSGFKSGIRIRIMDSDIDQKMAKTSFVY